MKRAQVAKFWQALEDSSDKKSVISSFKYRIGFTGERTLERFAQANDCFKEGLTSDEIAKKTQWSVKYVEKIRGWWEAKFDKTVTSPIHSTTKEEVNSSIDAVVEELRSLSVGSVQVDATNILFQLRDKLAVGISEWDIPMPDRPILAELRIHQIIQLEQRLTYSGPHQYHHPYWILTDLGNRVVQRLERENK